MNCDKGSDELLCGFKTYENSFCYTINSTEIFCKSNDAVMIDGQIPNYFKRLTIIGNIKNISFMNSLELTFLHVEKFPFYFIISKGVKLSNLVYLSITNSDTTSQDLTFPTEVKLLQYLDVSYNPIETLTFLKLYKPIKLKILNISHTKIKFFQTFRSLYKLEILEFSFKNFPLESVKHFDKLRIVKGTNFYLCCLIWKLHGSDKYCEPSKLIFQSCSNIIKLRSINILVWISGSLGILFNTISLLYTGFFVKKSKIYHFSLSAGDFLMSTYLICLAFVNNIYDTIEERAFWKTGFLCQIMGTIKTYSILLSMTSMVVITFERYQVITKPFKKSILTKYESKICLAFVLILIIISCIPFLNNNVNTNKIEFDFLERGFFSFRIRS